MARPPQAPPPKKRALLDHSIVGQQQLALRIRKDRNLAACRMCGAIFQPDYFMDTSDEEYNRTDMNTLSRKFAAEREIMIWREKHNKEHTDKQHLDFAASGLTFTPEAAYRLAPFGLVPVGDSTVVNTEVGTALAEAPRAPDNDAETTLKGYI